MTLNDKIQAYLAQSNIAFGTNDYQTGQPENQEDQILHWDAKLGLQPTLDQLTAAQAIKEAADLSIEFMPIVPTKTDLLAQLAALSAQIQALE